MQPRQPSASPPHDPLAGFAHEYMVPPEPLSRPLSGPGTPPLHRAAPIRLVQKIRMYHRLLRGKLHPLTVELRPERELGRGAGTDSNAMAGGPVVSIQPVIPGASVSPASIDVSALTGGEAKFWVMPVGRKGKKLPDCRIEFRSGGRLLDAVRAPTRVVTRRLAWFFLFLAIGIPLLLYWIRANPMLEFAPGPRARAGQGDVRPVAAPDAPSEKRYPGAIPAAPGVPKADDKATETGAEKKSSPAAGEAKPPEAKEAPGTTTPARPGSGGRPAAQGQPGGAPPRRAAGGGMMAVQAPPDVEAAARTPLNPRDSLDKWLTTRVLYRYVMPKKRDADSEPAGGQSGAGARADLSPKQPEPNHEPGLSVKSAELVRWPDEARGFLHLGLFYIKDGYSLSEEKNFPGLLDGYEFIMNDDWLPHQDFVIGAIFLVISILLWFLQGAASRRLKAGVLEIVPA